MVLVLFFLGFLVVILRVGLFVIFLVVILVLGLVVIFLVVIFLVVVLPVVRCVDAALFSRTEGSDSLKMNI